MKTLATIAGLTLATMTPSVERHAWLTFGLQYADQHISVEAARFESMAICRANLNALRNVSLRPGATGIWQAPTCSETKPAWWVDK
jgi:hypothetical protein